MKKSQLLAILALVMALGLASPAIFSAAAEEGQSAEETASSIERTTPEGAVSPTNLDNSEENVAVPTADENISAAAVSTLEELQAALGEDAETILINNTITIAADADLDLNGKTLKLADGIYRMFAIQQGNVVIKNGTLRSNDDATQTGNAILWVTGSDADADFANHTTLTVEDSVNIITKNSYGLAVHYLSDKQLARGLTVNFAGHIDAPYGISVNGNIQDIENAPVLNISGTVVSTDDLAIFAAGYAEWNLNGATLTGATPLGIKSGKFILENANLKATGAYQRLEATGSGMNPNGATFQIENSQPYAGNIDITVKSGTYESEKGPIFSEYGSTVARTAGSNLKSLSISGGTFKSAEDQPIFDSVAANETVITGGNFNNDEGLEDYLKTDQKLVKDENGNFVIQTVNTPVDPENPGSNPSEDNKPTTKPSDNKNPDGSLPNTGVLATIEHAANAVGAIGTTLITGALVASGAAIAFILGSRRRKAARSSRSGKSSKSSAKSAKSGRNFHLDRIEVEISAAPRTPAKAARASKTSGTASKSARTAAKAVSASRKSTSKAAKPVTKTTKKSSSKSAKTSKKVSSTAKSAPSRKSAASSHSTAKSAKKRS